MNVYSRSNAPDPQVAFIPDSSTKGVRFYREPAEPHPLQMTFLEAAGERAWAANMRSLLTAGRVAEADALLAAELAGFDGGLAQLCKATPAADVVVTGWEDLLPILDEWEGPPITAITLGLTNPPDLVFEGNEDYEPDLLLGLYSDEAFSFSTNKPDTDRGATRPDYRCQRDPSSHYFTCPERATAGSSAPRPKPSLPVSIRGETYAF